MSYPPPRYLGRTGERTARHGPAEHPPEWTYPNGNTVHYLETGASANGQSGLYRWVDWVHVPEGGVHGFRNESGQPASMLLHFAPGGPREDYFEGLPLPESMTAEEHEAFFLRHDTFWV
jgi:hypothetical protein